VKAGRRDICGMVEEQGIEISPEAAMNKMAVMCGALRVVACAQQRERNVAARGYCQRMLRARDTPASTCPQ